MLELLTRAHSTEFDDIAHISHGFEHTTEPDKSEELLNSLLPKAWYYILMGSIVIDTMLTIMFAAVETCPPPWAYVLDGIITSIFAFEVFLNGVVWGVCRYVARAYHLLLFTIHRTVTV